MGRVGEWGGGGREVDIVNQEVKATSIKTQSHTTSSCLSGTGFSPQKSISTSPWSQQQPLPDRDSVWPSTKFLVVAFFFFFFFPPPPPPFFFSFFRFSPSTSAGAIFHKAHFFSVRIWLPCRFCKQFATILNKLGVGCWMGGGEERGVGGLGGGGWGGGGLVIQG